jgi:hypothetical protein
VATCAVFLTSLNAATFLRILCRDKCLVNSSIESPSLSFDILFNSNARFAGNLDLREFQFLISNTAGVFSTVCVNVARRVSNSGIQCDRGTEFSGNVNSELCL